MCYSYPPQVQAWASLGHEMSAPRLGSPRRVAPLLSALPYGGHGVGDAAGLHLQQKGGRGMSPGAGFCERIITVAAEQPVTQDVVQSSRFGRFHCSSRSLLLLGS